MQVNLTAFLLGLTAVLNLCVGLYVYWRGTQVHQTRAFTSMSIAISIWTTAVAVAHYGTVGHTWAVRLAFAAASLIPLCVLHFINCFAADRKSDPKLGYWLFIPTGAILSALSFTRLVVVSATPETTGSGAVYGPLHSTITAYVSVCFAYAAWRLLSSYRRSSGILRVQIRYLLLAIAIPSGLATGTNLIVPVLLGTSALVKYGPLFSLPLLVLIGHAIIRHRLLNIRVVIKRSVVYLAALGSAGLILVCLIIGSNLLLRDQHRASIREIILTLAVALLVGPLKSKIQKAFDRYLYREPYDYQRTVREASKALAETIDLPKLLTYIAEVITRTLKSESVAIYIRHEDDPALDFGLSRGIAHYPQQLQMSSSLVSSMCQTRETIFRDEIRQVRIPAGTRDVYDEMQRLNAEVVVPLVEQDQVIGLLCLGPKRSGDPYFSDDADLLTTLANQSAVAIRNAQTHQRVVQMNEELQKILSTIESGVIAIGAKGKITHFNPAAEQLTGVSAQDACGRTLDCLPAILAQLIAATAGDGQSRSQVEFSLPDTAGQLVPLVCSTSPLLGAQGAPAGAVAVLADLSRLKELEQEKHRAERLESFEAIASGIVHEIRNPLVAIKTFTQLLPIRYADEDYRETFSRVADREIRRIEDLLTRLRTVSSASSQPTEPVDVRGPLQETLETLQPMLEQCGVRLRRVADGTPRRIQGNASQLVQLFLNLCLNSIEAMESGGELTVRVADLSDGGGTTLLVEISDTGSGIPEELLGTIFNPFVTTKAHGMGLGLAICRNITDAHHARLSARNNAGRPGSTFTIEFPVLVAGAVRITT